MPSLVADRVIDHLQERSMPVPPLDAVYRASTMCHSEHIAYAECDYADLGDGRGRWRLAVATGTTLTVMELEASMHAYQADGWDPNATYTLNWSRPFLPIVELMCGPGHWIPQETPEGHKYNGVHWVFVWPDKSYTLPFSEAGRNNWQVVASAHRVVNLVQNKWDISDDLRGNSQTELPEAAPETPAADD